MSLTTPIISAARRDAPRSYPACSHSIGEGPVGQKADSYTVFDKNQFVFNLAAGLEIRTSRYTDPPVGLLGVSVAGRLGSGPLATGPYL